MAEYRVRWTNDLDASCPQEAADAALAIMRRFDSSATVFAVWPPVGLETWDVRPDGSVRFDQDE